MNAVEIHDKCTFSGYHKFPYSDNEGGGYGSFEVFYEDETQETGKGWYWHACSPGCLPDGDSTGPFPTAEGAYLDAIGE